MNSEDRLDELREYSEKPVGYFLPLSALEYIQKSTIGESFALNFYKMITEFEVREDRIFELKERTEQQHDRIGHLEMDLAAMTKERDKLKRQAEKNARRQIPLTDEELKELRISEQQNGESS